MSKRMIQDQIGPAKSETRAGLERTTEDALKYEERLREP